STAVTEEVRTGATSFYSMMAAHESTMVDWRGVGSVWFTFLSDVPTPPVMSVAVIVELVTFDVVRCDPPTYGSGTASAVAHASDGVRSTPGMIDVATGKNCVNVPVLDGSGNRACPPVDGGFVVSNGVVKSIIQKRPVPS